MLSTNLPGSQRGEENAVTWSYMKQPEQNHKTICGQGKGIRWEGGKRIKLINTSGQIPEMLWNALQSLDLSQMVKK